MCGPDSFLLFEACLAKGLKILWDVFLSGTAIRKELAVLIY